MAEKGTATGNNMDPALRQVLKEFELRLRRLIADTVERVSEETLPDKPLEELTDEEIAAYCDRLNFELKASLATSLPGTDIKVLKKDFEVFENQVKRLKERLEEERRRLKGVI